MKGAALTSAVSRTDGQFYTLMNFIDNMLKPVSLGYGSTPKPKMQEIKVDVRETKGTKYHLRNTTLNPNRYYILMLTGTAYEVENGNKVWCTYVKRNNNGKMETVRIQWRQTKFYFFSTAQSEPVPPVIYDLQPYVAAAFPASADGRLVNTLQDGDIAYAGDLALPTIALKEDIAGYAFTNGHLQWKLLSQLAGGEKKWKTETIDNQYVKVAGMINLQPTKPFSIYNCPSNLQLTYTYKVPAPCYRNTTAEKWEVMELYIKQNENWSAFKEEMEYYGFDPEDVSTNQQLALAVGYADMWLNYSGAERKSRWQTYFTHYKADNASCQKDTTVVLADLWYNGVLFKSWYDVTANQKAYTDLLPYTKPFVGIKPSATPTYTYDGKYTTTSAFTNNEVRLDEDGSRGYTKYRLQDPYMYFAYLSDYVFISGLSIKSYAFDDVSVPFGSESLTLTYNGELVEGKSLINGVREQLATCRDRMYDTWNRWNYGSAQKGNDSFEPLWPLPDGSGEMYERTKANQNGKTPHYRPYTGAGYPHMYATAEFAKDFAAPYYIAEALSNKMSDIAQTLKGIYSNNIIFPDGDAKFEEKMKNWNNLHRGQYLTVSSRGFEVRVPYYQFPLIFGDCFAKQDIFGTKQPYDHTRLQWVNESKRSFNSSLSTPSYVSTRWSAALSNVFFFRMCGGYPFTTDTGGNTYVWKNTGRMSGGKPYYANYVNQELFSAEEALKNVKTLPMKIYRTQGYDITNGKYYINESVGAAGYLQYYYQAFYLTITKDPLHDAGSDARIELKKNMNDWMRLVGKPQVTVNDSRMKSK